MSVAREICDWAMEDNRYQVILVAALPYIVFWCLALFAPGYILPGFENVYKWNWMPDWAKYITPTVLAMHLWLSFKILKSRGFTTPIQHYLDGSTQSIRFNSQS